MQHVNNPNQTTCFAKVALIDIDAKEQKAKDG